MKDMRDKHLTAEEIIKYMDASDMSEDYLLWMEETAAHIQTCDICQERLHRAMTAESVCDEEGLAAGLKLMGYEEEIRKNILIAHLNRMRDQTRVAELIRRIQNGYAQRFAFSTLIPLGRAAAMRGVDDVGSMGVDVAEGTEKVTGKQKVIVEQQEDKLLVKISGRMGMGSNTIKEEKVTILVCIEGEEPRVEEAVWDVAHGQYVAELDTAVMKNCFELWIL